MPFVSIPRKAVEGYAKRVREEWDAEALEKAGEHGADQLGRWKRERRAVRAAEQCQGYLDALRDMGVSVGLIIMEGEALARGEPGLPRLVLCRPRVDVGDGPPND